MLHSPFTESFLFSTFLFSILTEKQMSFKNQQLYPKGFFYVRKGVLIISLLPLKRSPKNTVEI